MSIKNRPAISRRDFARRAALVSAAASLSPAGLLTDPPATATAATPLQTPSAPASKAPAQPQTPAATKLSPESQAEVDARVQAIFSQYGKHLSDAQKADLQRLAAEGQASLDRLRAFATDNGDGPALYLKPLMERERKPSSKTSSTTAKAPAAPKSP